MAMMVQQKCWCGKKFEARAIDVRRGWAKSCCKSHAAFARTRKQRAKRSISAEALRQKAEYDTYEAGMDGLDFDWSPF